LGKINKATTPNFNFSKHDEHENKEESPYKPDTVNRWNFEREFTFARYFCPFLFTSKCQFNEL